jgi:hypothetical protein
MSLINDALQRAGEADRRRRSKRDRPRLSPLQPAPSPRGGGSGLKWLGSLLVLCLAVAGWALWQTDSAPPQTATPPKRISPSNAVAPPRLPSRPLPGADPFPAITNLPTRASESATPASRIKVDTNLVVRSAPASAPVETEPPPDSSAPLSTPPSAAVDGAGPPLPNLRLQSIIYRLTQPTAMINGQSVQIGDLLEGARVVEIQRQSVTLEWQGTRHVLTLPSL